MSECTVYKKDQVAVFKHGSGYTVEDLDGEQARISFDAVEGGRVRVAVAMAVAMNGKVLGRMARFDLGNAEDTFARDEISISPTGLLVGACAEEMRWGDMTIPAGFMLRRGFALQVPDGFVAAVEFALNEAFKSAQEQKDSGR